MSRLQGAGGPTVTTTAMAVGLTTIANMGTKSTITWTTGGAAVDWPVLRGKAAGMAVGALAVAWVMLTWKP